MGGAFRPKNEDSPRAKQRSAHSIVGGHGRRLRQTIIALVAGQELAEHESPGEATLQVLVGEVHLATAADSILLSAGESAVIPDERDSLAALEDCAVLLTAALASRLSWRRSRGVR